MGWDKLCVTFKVKGRQRPLQGAQKPRKWRMERTEEGEMCRRKVQGFEIQDFELGFRKCYNTWHSSHGESKKWWLVFGG